MIPSLALFTPLPPEKTGIAEYTEALLPYIAQAFRITVVTSGSYLPARRTRHLCKSLQVQCKTYEQFQSEQFSYDLVAYQLGNSQAHDYMFDALHRYPGLVLLHDLVLYHGILYDCLHRQSADEFADEMHYAYGREGRISAQSVLRGGKDSSDAYPLIERVLDDALAVVVFNSYMEERVSQLSPEVMCTWIPLHTSCPPGFPRRFDPQSFRASLGLANVPVVATLGLFNPHNRLQTALLAFKRLLDDCPEAVYLMVGEPPDRQQLSELVASLGLEARVRFTGWVSSQDFERYVRIPDVAIQLRYPHAGSTCYNPIRLAAWGVPTIISRIEPMRDIPGDVMVAIDPTAKDEIEQVYTALRSLLLDKPEWARMSARATSFAESTHSPRSAAGRLVDFAYEVISKQAILHNQRMQRYCQRSASLGLQSLLAEQAKQALSDLGCVASEGGWIRDIAEDIVAFTEPPFSPSRQGPRR